MERKIFFIASVVLLLGGSVATAMADTSDKLAAGEWQEDPLQPPDFSSPRSTLQTFFASLDAIGETLAGAVTLGTRVARGPHGLALFSQRER
jgi:hypothetical protein